jgi:hypothetical protein
MSKYACLPATPWNMALAVEDGAMHTFHVATSRAGKAWWVQDTSKSNVNELGVSCSREIDSIAEAVQEESGRLFPCVLGNIHLAACCIRARRMTGQSKATHASVGSTTACKSKR